MAIRISNATTISPTIAVLFLLNLFQDSCRGVCFTGFLCLAFLLSIFCIAGVYIFAISLPSLYAAFGFADFFFALPAMIVVLSLGSMITNAISTIRLMIVSTNAMIRAPPSTEG